MENTNLKLIIGGIVIMAICLFVGYAQKPSEPLFDPLGATVYNRMISFDEGIAVDGQERISGTGSMVEGGADTTLTAGQSVTVTATQICNSSILSFESATPTAATTLPTVANLVADCFKADGDAKTILFRNTGAAASTTVITAGSGMVLLEPDGQNVVVAGANSALIHLFRTSATEMAVSVDELIDAD